MGTVNMLYTDDDGVRRQMTVPLMDGDSMGQYVMDLVDREYDCDSETDGTDVWYTDSNGEAVYPIRNMSFAFTCDSFDDPRPDNADDLVSFLNAERERRPYVEMRELLNECENCRLDARPLYTRTYRVYGAPGHQQAVSFNKTTARSPLPLSSLQDAKAGDELRKVGFLLDFPEKMTTISII